MLLWNCAYQVVPSYSNKFSIATILPLQELVDLLSKKKYIVRIRSSSDTHSIWDKKHWCHYDELEECKSSLKCPIWDEWCYYHYSWKLFQCIELSYWWMNCAAQTRITEKLYYTKWASEAPRHISVFIRNRREVHKPYDIFVFMNQKTSRLHKKSLAWSSLLCSWISSRVY